MSERSEMLLDHAIHAFNKNSVFPLKKLVAWIGPLLDCLFHQSFGNDKGVVIWEFPCLRSEPHLSDRIVDEGQYNSLQGHFHDLVNVDGTVIRTELRLLRREEGRRLVMCLFPGFVRPEIWGSLSDSVLELHMKRSNDLVDSMLIWRAFHEGR